MKHNRSSRWILLVFLASLNLCSEFYASAESSFLIVDNGKGIAKIVIEKKALNDDSHATKKAASELQKYVEKATGVTLPIVDDSSNHTGNLIHVGENRLTKKFNISSTELEPEGFEIKTIEENNLAIIGRDDNGVSFGVYAFLEEFLGVRWFFPGELGEVVPKVWKLIVNNVNVKGKPDYKMRTIGGRGNEEYLTWRWRNRLGRSIVIDNAHAYGRIIPSDKYLKEHPEYYALIDGIRGGQYLGGGENINWKRRNVHWQLCTTNPDVINLTVEYLRKRFDEDPSLMNVSISPNDGNGWCECDRCQALDTGRTLTKYGITRISRSNRVFTFANNVAKDLKKTHPEKYVTCYVYAGYLLNPTFEMEKNFIPIVCLGSKDNWNPLLRKQNMEILHGWGKRSDIMMMYDYYMYGDMPGTPRPITHLIGEWIPLCYSLGARFFYAQGTDDFATNGPNYYLASRLLWDVDLDPAEVLYEYYSMLYGKAAHDVKAYYDVFENAWRELMSSGVDPEWSGCDIMPDFYTPEVLDRAKRRLDEAEKISQTESEIVRKRIELIRDGFHYLELFMDAFDKTLYVKEHAFPVMDFRLSSDPERITNSIVTAYEAWLKRDQFMETLRDRHIINVNHELNHSNEGTLERRVLKWLLDRMKETTWPHYLN